MRGNGKITIPGEKKTEEIVPETERDQTLRSAYDHPEPHWWRLKQDCLWTGGNNQNISGIKDLELR